MEIEGHDPFETANRRYRILGPDIQRAQQPEHGRFTGRLAELDEMFGGIVQAFLGLRQLSRLQERVAELAIGQRESFLIADAAMAFERVVKMRGRLVSMALPGLFHAEVVIEDAEGAVVV